MLSSAHVVIARCASPAFERGACEDQAVSVCELQVYWRERARNAASGDRENTGCLWQPGQSHVCLCVRAKTEATPATCGSQDSRIRTTERRACSRSCKRIYDCPLLTNH